MNRSESFRQAGTAFFAKYADVAHSWKIEPGGCELSIPASSRCGFDIGFDIGEDADLDILYWRHWHTHIGGEFSTVEEMFAYLRDMLSPDMRVREVHSRFGSRGCLEYFDGTEWLTEIVEGGFFLPWGKRRVKTFSNSVLPGRISKPDQDAGPDQGQGGDDAD
jgi:hypothetical protein